MRANRLLLAGICLVAAVVTGCGDSGTTAANGKTDGENIVASVDDLPNCTSKREGNVLFVTEEDGNYQMQVCEDGIWKEMGQPLAVFESDDEFPNCTPSREGNEAYANSESTVYVCNDGTWTEKMQVQTPENGKELTSSFVDEEKKTESSGSTEMDDGKSSNSNGEASGTSVSGSSTSSSSSINSSTSVKSSTSMASFSPRVGPGPVSQYGELKAGTNSSGNGRIYGTCNDYSTSGHEVQVRGMSLFWSMDSAQSKYWSKSTVNGLVQKLNIELIRAAMGVDGDWGYGNYFTKTSFYQGLMDDVVQAAIDNDIYVIIDYHSHIANENVANAKSFFSRMAQKWGGYDNVIFEIFNEPACAVGGSTSCSNFMTWSTIKNYATQVIATIRQYSDNLVIVGTPMWDQQPNAAISSPINDANVAYAFHYYAGTHSTSSEGANAVSAMNAGLSVFVSEWGTINADGDGSVAGSNSGWQTWLDTYKLSSANWAVSDKAEGASMFTTAGAWNYSASGNWVKNNVFSKNPSTYTTCGSGQSTITPVSSSSSGGQVTSGTDVLGGDGAFDNCTSLASCGWTTQNLTLSDWVELELNDDYGYVLGFHKKKEDVSWALQVLYDFTLTSGYAYQIVGDGYTYDGSYGTVYIGVLDKADNGIFEWQGTVDGGFMSVTYNACGTNESARLYVSGGEMEGGFAIRNIRLMRTPISCN